MEALVFGDGCGLGACSEALYRMVCWPVSRFRYGGALPLFVQRAFGVPPLVSCVTDAALVKGLVPCLQGLRLILCLLSCHL